MQQIAKGGRGLIRLAADPGAVEAAFARAENGAAIATGGADP